MMLESLVILGTGGNAYDVLEIVAALNGVRSRWTVVGFLDDAMPAGSTYHEFPILGRLVDAVRFRGARFINVIGSDVSFRHRRRIIASTGLQADEFATLVHPRAAVSQWAKVGRGVYVSHGCSIGGGATVGDHASLAPGAILGHDSTVGDYAIIAPGAAIGGFCTIGPESYIGSRSAVRQQTRIGTGALVGMGAVVIHDVPDSTTVVGNPARVLLRSCCHSHTGESRHNGKNPMARTHEAPREHSSDPHVTKPADSTELKAGSTMTRPISVLITGVGGRSVGHQVLQAVNLADGRYRPVVTDVSSFSYGLYCASSQYLVPPATAPNYVSAIREIVAREKIAAILPGTQDEAAVLSANIGSLGSDCHLIANPAPLVELCRSKRQLQIWLDAQGIPSPRWSDADGWRDLARQCGFPLIVKPVEDTGGSKGVAILADEAEVHDWLANVRPASVMFQEYVGGMDSEFTVGVMISREGKIIDSIVMHRNLVGLTMGTRRVIAGKPYGLSTGYSQGYIVRNERIGAFCEDLALKLGARGPLNIQLRVAGGREVVFEVHPRFSGTTSIRAQVGFNEADTLIQNFVFGQQFGRLRYQTDVAAIRAFSNVIIPRQQMNAVPQITGIDGGSGDETDSTGVAYANRSDIGPALKLARARGDAPKTP